ncbi:hypothetical protein TWF481_010793 [Arthrobotrys musiformis]|uniref:Uncharacterized protein n=1 Tax=Arthrobotrys musiformis TaxID=47236 RepID=A0AAV9W367_9PEZI
MGSIKPLINLVFTLVFCVWISASIPTPAGRSPITHHGLNIFDDIEWAGPVAPGGENYTFFGNLESIRTQIESTPGFDPSVFDTVPSLADHSNFFSKRATGTFNVECIRTSDKLGGADLAGYIVALKKLQDFHGSCSVTGRACKRFGCGKDGSLGLCVYREGPFNIECKEVFRIAEILVNTMLSDFTGKVPNKCRLLKGDKKSAIYYHGDIYWSLDGRWWSISAWHQSCLFQPGLTIPSPWPQRASDFIEPTRTP